LREIDTKGQAAREALRPAEIDAVCGECGTRFRGRPALTFLGFQRLQCPNCSQTVLLPLKKGYLITYWVILGLMVIGAIDGIAKGGIPFPGLLGIAALIGVGKDIQLRRKLAAGDARRSPK
jgi:DNA-directed RNA polymerase subunit RPC12/RpoP